MSLWAVLVLLGFLLWLRRRPLPTRTLFLVFVAWYGTGRIVEDFFRIDETHGLGLTASQWFSVAAVVIAIGMLVARRTDWATQPASTTGEDASAEPMHER